MRHFRRVLRHVLAQYKAVLLSTICAILAAVLFSLSLLAVLPLMKVMIGEEGLHGWVHRSIIKKRYGITFQPIPLSEYALASPSQSAGPNNAPEPGNTSAIANQPTVAAADSPPLIPPLQINSIKKDGPAADNNIQPLDIVVAVTVGSEAIDTSRRNLILKTLAEAPPKQPVTLNISRTLTVSKSPPGTQTLSELTVTITPEKPPFYAGLAQYLLSFVPLADDFTTAQQADAFQQNCLKLMIAVMLLATFLRCILRFLQQYLVKRIAFTTIMRLRIDMYHSAIRLPLGYFSDEGTTDTMSRFVQDANKVVVGITTLLGKLVREPFKVIFLAAGAMAIDAKMTLIVIAAAPFAAVIFGKLGRKMKRATRRTLENWSRLLARLQDTLLGVRVVKGYHREDYEEQRFLAVHERLFKQQLRMGKIDAAGGPILEALGMAAASAAMIVAVGWITGGDMTTSDFFAVVLLLGAMAESGRKLGNVYPRLQSADTAAERLYELVDTPFEHDHLDAHHLAPLKDKVEIKNLSFTYRGSTTPALDGINLDVPAGQTIAIVGPNGSGKTTLLSLLPRFFQPDTGSILIDGQDIATATLASLREQIGIVTQRTVVFNESIAANIAYGNPQADQQQIVAAAKQAFAHEFIELTPDGYDTIIGEQGATLSGGQLQRIAIARAILRNPAILILDEAMSQIDSESEAKIQKAIAAFARDRTSFIIAHRLSTIIDSDCIVVLDRGRIVAKGTHQELLGNCQLYRQLYETQFTADSEQPLPHDATANPQ